jgi:gluconolactonase
MSPGDFDPPTGATPIASGAPGGVAVRDAVAELSSTADGLDHPEAVAWFDGGIWCGTEAGQLLRIDAETHDVEIVAETGGFLLGLAFDARGRCYACDSGEGRLLRISRDGAVEVLADTVEGSKLFSPNFPAFTSDGTLWVAESGTWAHEDGYLFRIPPGGRPEVVDRQCKRFPNGLAVSPDGTTLYLVESGLPGVVTFDLRKGSLGPRQEWLLLPGTVPDGLAFDIDGSLYISCWRPDRVYRRRADGTLEVFLDDPTAEFMNSPTNLCFGGRDLRTLYLASLCGWSIRELHADVRGHAIVLPTL